MAILDALRRRLTPPPARIVFPEGADPRVEEAAVALAAVGVARPLLLVASADRPAPAGVEVRTIADARTPDLVARYVADRGVPRSVAERMLSRPLLLAAAMTRDGAADALLAGAAHPTRDVVTACEALLGRAPGVPLAIGVELVQLRDGRALVLADCALTAAPTAQELCAITLQAATTAGQWLGREPRVALLSSSTHGSAGHAAVTTVATARSLVRDRAPELPVDGELQADVALDPDVAARKLPLPGPVAGRADVLVFPDLDAADIGAKLIRSLADAAAYGVFLQGYARPVADVSRGASVPEIVGTATALAALVQAARV